MLDNFPHIKAYWIQIGVKLAQIALFFGADDLVGTVVDETITHAAGATTASGLTRTDFERMIRESGREPVERDARLPARRARGPERGARRGFRVNRRAFPAFLLLAAAAAAAGCLAQQYRSNPRVTVVDGDPIVQMKSPNAFPAVVKPSLVDLRQHSDPPDADSRVLGYRRQGRPARLPDRPPRPLRGRQRRRRRSSLSSSPAAP